MTRAAAHWLGRPLRTGQGLEGTVTHYKAFSRLCIFLRVHGTPSADTYHLLLGEETLLGIFKGLIVTLSVIELENPRERLDGDLNPQPTCLIIIYLFIFL